jgi:group I intron endonuclease
MQGDLQAPKRMTPLLHLYFAFWSQYYIIKESIDIEIVNNIAAVIKNNYYNISCVYAIVNSLNNKRYIGSTKMFQGRYTTHLNYLKDNRHHNKLLQDDYNKFGEDNFYFEIFELIDDFSNISDIEEKYMDKYRTLYSDFGYNINNPKYPNNFSDEKRNKPNYTSKNYNIINRPEDINYLKISCNIKVIEEWLNGKYFGYFYHKLKEIGLKINMGTLDFHNKYYKSGGNWTVEEAFYVAKLLDKKIEDIFYIDYGQLNC